MMHPLFRLLATRPELLAEHLGAYAQLATAEAGEAAAALRTRALFIAVMVLCLVLGAGLAGTALLLLAAVPMSAMPVPWLLLAVPMVPWAVALGCWVTLRQQPGLASFAQLREQVAMDTALLQEAGQA